jgi:hypothetical protein
MLINPFNMSGSPLKNHFGKYQDFFTGEVSKVNLALAFSLSLEVIRTTGSCLQNVREIT